MSAPIRRSPVAAMHRSNGAVIDLDAGWELPTSYGDSAVASRRLREAVAVGDITMRAKVDVRGALDEALGAVGDALAVRIARDWALVLGPPGAEANLVRRLEEAAGAGSMVTDATHLFAGFALCGPLLPDLLHRVTAWDPAALAVGSGTGAPIADVRAVIVRRELPLPTMEVYVGTEHGRYVWETLLDVAEGLGGGAVGWSALREAGWS